MLRQVVSKHQRDWDEHLPLLTMAYRSSVHESTGYTPNYMMLGRELPMPSHLLARPPQETELSTTSHVQELQSRLQEAHEIARRTGAAQHVRAKKQHDRRSQPVPLAEGDWVWLFNPTKKVGFSPKLTIFWEEQPYQLEKFLNGVTAVIRRGAAGKERVVHVDRLMKCPEGVRSLQRGVPGSPPQEKSVLSPLEKMGLEHTMRGLGGNVKATVHPRQ